LGTEQRSDEYSPQTVKVLAIPRVLFVVALPSCK
jgi:hypothetical protein